MCNANPVFVYDLPEIYLGFTKHFIYLRGKSIAIIPVFAVGIKILGFAENQNPCCSLCGVRFSTLLFAPLLLFFFFSFSFLFFSFLPFSSLPSFFGSWQIETGYCTGVNSCCRISLETEDIFRCDHFPLSLIVKKVRPSLSDPHCVSNLPLFRSTSALFSPFFWGFSPSLVLSGSINHAWERRALSWGNFLGVEWVIH